MSKRRRHDLEQSNDEDISDLLDNFPLLYRSIQASSYVLKNPPRLEEDVKNQDKFNYVYRYMFDLLKKFFSGYGLFINKFMVVIDDTMCEFFVDGSSLKESEIDGIFGVLGTVLKSFFVSPTTPYFSFRADGDSLHFLLYYKLDYFDLEYNNLYAKRREQIIKRFTEHPDLYIVL